MTTTVQQAINRGNNVLVSAFLVALAVGLIGTMFSEPEWIDRLDDILLILLAVIAAAWYFYRDNRYNWSVVPVGLLFLALVGKLIGLVLEMGDPESVGDEAGIVPLIGTLLVIAGFLVWKAHPPKNTTPTTGMED